MHDGSFGLQGMIVCRMSRASSVNYQRNIRV